MLKAVARASLGLAPAPNLEWETAPPALSPWLPMLAWQLGEQAPARLKGLLRHHWARYQVSLQQLRQIREQTEAPCMVLDDLALAGQYYPAPATRTLEGLDLYLAREAADLLKARLLEVGWSVPPWPDPMGFQELRNPQGSRLRLHHLWLPSAPEPEPPGLWERAHQAEDWLWPARQDLIWRCAWRAASPLWVADLYWLGSPSASPPAGLEPILWRCRQLARQGWGVDLLPGKYALANWGLVDWALALSHGRSTRWAWLIQDLARDLRARGRAGLPGDWLESCCRLWNLKSPWQIPAKAWQRWNS